MKNSLIIMCGIPGSGKTTWILNNIKYLEGNTTVVSRDAIRFELLQEGDDYFSKENEVFAYFIASIKKVMKDNNNVIVDATHINEKSRKKLLKSLGKIPDNYKVYIVYVKTPLKKIFENNDKRSGLQHVPQEQIERMYQNFREPCLEEGFDSIVIYDTETDSYLIREKG